MFSLVSLKFQEYFVTAGTFRKTLGMHYREMWKKSGNNNCPFSNKGKMVFHLFSVSVTPKLPPVPLQGEVNEKVISI